MKVKNPAAPAVRRETEEDWGLSDGRAGGIPEMTNLSPFFEFVLLLVVPGALIILLVALLWTGET